VNIVTLEREYQSELARTRSRYVARWTAGEDERLLWQEQAHAAWRKVARRNNIKYTRRRRQ